MNYKQARIVVFTLPNEMQVVSEDLFWEWLYLPALVLQRLKLHLQGFSVHLKQEECFKQGNVVVEKELIILPYFNMYYEALLGDKFNWVDPIHVFVNDIEQEILQKTNAVVWIFAMEKNAVRIASLLHAITTDVYIYDQMIREHDVPTVIDFPRAIAA